MKCNCDNDKGCPISKIFKDGKIVPIRFYLNDKNEYVFEKDKDFEMGELQEDIEDVLSLDKYESVIVLFNGRR